MVISNMLLDCCHRICGTSSKIGQSDDPTIHGLSLSDCSIASSSQKSISLNSRSDIEKKTGNLTFDIDLNHNLIAEDGTIASDDSTCEKLMMHELLPGGANSPPPPPPPRQVAPPPPMSPSLPQKYSHGGPYPPPPLPPTPPVPFSLKAAPQTPPRLTGSVPPPPPLPPPVPFSLKTTPRPLPAEIFPPPLPPPLLFSLKTASQPPPLSTRGAPLPSHVLLTLKTAPLPTRSATPPPPPPPVLFSLKTTPQPPPLSTRGATPPLPPLPPVLFSLKTPPQTPPQPTRGAPPPPPPPLLSSLKTPPQPPPQPTRGAPPPPPPPLLSSLKTPPQPPPQPTCSTPPPRPSLLVLKPPLHSPFGLSNLSSTKTNNDDAIAPKPKLKPFFWDKVMANNDHSMVWHQLKSGSFKFNEEMIETMFGYTPTEKNKIQSKESSYHNPSNRYIQIIDSKKSRNLSIMLKALNVTTKEIANALQEGDPLSRENTCTVFAQSLHSEENRRMIVTWNELPCELIQALLKMAPTADEELKLMIYNGELSSLGTADRFLKVLVDIPLAFKRLQELLFMSNFQEDKITLMESFSTLEAACNELKKSRMFLKLLEAVLKTGNRMNDGTFRGGAHAFKLDTLLKLSDVKGVDTKTTLLHFVVQEIIRSEGIRAARTAQTESRKISIINPDVEEHYRTIGLEVVSGLGIELDNVKKSAVLDVDNITRTVSKLGNGVIRSRDFLNSIMTNIDKESGFYRRLRSFVKIAEVDIQWLLEEENRIMKLVKNTGDYFHGNNAKDEGLRLFEIVRDFLLVLEKVCKEVQEAPKKTNRQQKIVQTTSKSQQHPKHDLQQRLFQAIKDRRVDEYSSSSDEESRWP